ncbi:MAG: cation transporter, partial [Gammaproteobacteria bacterium]|nr:cation transporter [Gammaproteobacteria bacterium]
MACTSCHSSCSTDATSSAQTIDPRWRKALWIALAVNASMFFVELFAGLQANSVSLLADAVDFAGDAANYALEFVFTYRSDERTPHAMRRDDGQVFTLHYDQIGSLRAVADHRGNV